MELIEVRNQNTAMVSLPFDGKVESKHDLVRPSERREVNNSPFIEANTKEIYPLELSDNCLIPVFAKDNEKTIAHQEFIETAFNVAKELFPNEIIDAPEIRVSHQIKGRIPEAIHKKASELLEHEKTQYYERMAFIIRIPSISKTINGNTLSLMMGGVRSYNQQNLYSKKTFEK